MFEVNKALVVVIKFFCQQLTQEFRLGFSPDSSSGLEENSIESSLYSATLLIYFCTVCPYLFYKSLSVQGLIPVHVIFFGHGQDDS